MPRLAIDTDYLTATLKALLAIPSPSGYNDTIVRSCGAELRRLGVETETTRRGAIRAKLPGQSAQPARAVIAHLDTLGAQVKQLKDNGRLELVPIGHWSARFAEGARVTVFTERGGYRGTILLLKASGHTYGDAVDTAPIGWEHVELRVDAIARDRGDLRHLGFDVGDIVAIDPQPEFLDNGYIVSRHLDDKAGVAILLAALEALIREGSPLPVDTFWLFSVAEEVGVGAASVLTQNIASMLTVDDGTSAPGQSSSEFGVTIAMADQTGPFDWHLTKRMVELCREHDIRYQKDVFRYYRSDCASAIEAGEDVRTALVTSGVDASHGYERIHLNALRSIAEFVTAYATSDVAFWRDAEPVAPLLGFPKQPMRPAELVEVADVEVAEAKG